eukprot:1163886-Prymnesium_polylepis.2
MATARGPHRRGSANVHENCYLPKVRTVGELPNNNALWSDDLQWTARTGVYVHTKHARAQDPVLSMLEPCAGHSS